jgi:hypothetical protein
VNTQHRIELQRMNQQPLLIEIIHQEKRGEWLLVGGEGTPLRLRFPALNLGRFPGLWGALGQALFLARELGATITIKGPGTSVMRVTCGPGAGD